MWRLKRRARRRARDAIRSSLGRRVSWTVARAGGDRGEGADEVGRQDVSEQLLALLRLLLDDRKQLVLQLVQRPEQEATARGSAGGYVLVGTARVLLGRKHHASIRGGACVMAACSTCTVAACDTAWWRHAARCMVAVCGSRARGLDSQMLAQQRGVRAVVDDAESVRECNPDGRVEQPHRELEPHLPNQ